VGFRLWRRRSALLLDLGRSSLALYLLPPGVRALAGRTGLLLMAADRSALGRVGAALVRLRRPDPYRAKGVRRLDRPLPPLRRRRDGRT
jgi:large subunit ribosomal protein L6